MFVGSFITPRSHPRRGAVQAFCNVGIGTLGALAAAFGFEWGVILLAGALSTALSDTMSSELGQKWGGAPRSLLLGPTLKSGADGGMSGLGTAFGIVGAMMIPLVAVMFGANFTLATVASITIAGILGNFIDSLFGLFVQSHLGTFGNDWTNLLATSAGAGVALMLAG